jgi:MtrB/PioB family decaheme-associated outer membrane protein
MRNRFLRLVAALALTSAGANAQTASEPTPQADTPKASAPGSALPGAPATAPAAIVPEADLANQVDVGVRGTIFGDNSDRARFQRYRDLGNGAFLDRFRFTRQTDQWLFNAQADNVGYLDQRFSSAFNAYGKVKASFEWNQIPLFYSQDTRTPYTSTTPGVLRLDAALPLGVQNKTLTLADVAAAAAPFDMRMKRDVADFKLTYSMTKDLDVNVTAKNTTKNGQQPWGATFGFSDAVEVPVPVDHRTTDLGANLEWSNGPALLRLGYDGSFFRNNISTLVWDNPIIGVDSATAGPSQGRMALWPNSDVNTGSITGSITLPARSRATAYVSIGNWSQNDPLIPFTINSQLPVIPLDRTTADAKAVVTATNVNFTSRPTSMVWFSVRYRSYDFDNQTPVFHVANTVGYDTAVESFAPGSTSPYSYSRRTLDADVSLTPITYAAFRVGYTREVDDQTFRSFATTTQDTVRASIDATGVRWLTLRAVYEHAKRVGSGLDEQTLDDIGEQISLRQFDISDLTSDRFSTILMVTPMSQLSFNASISAGREDRPATAFGLRSNDNTSYSVGFDFVPRDPVSLGLNYTYESYDALQGSREANPGVQFNDPTRDWTTDGTDKVHTLTASADFLKAIPRTEMRFAYDYSRAQSVYVYGLAPNTTLPPVVQLPPVLNQLQRATADVRYHLTRHVAVGLAYWFDKYDVNDFALGPATLNTLAQPSFLILGYVFRPYTAQTVMGRLTYLW